MKIVSISRILELLEVDTESGVMRWKKRRGSAAKGRIAGSINTCGYRVVVIDGSIFNAHRLIYAVHHKRWPKKEIDHINGDRLDNRISNLREVTHTQNIHNSQIRADNKTGFKGVTFFSRLNKYKAQIVVNKKFYHLGYFDRPGDAAEAYKNASIDLHKEYSIFAGSK